MALGKTITCMVKVPIHGVMAENIKVNITWIRNTDMECTIGQMEEDMKAIGLTVNSMVKENISYQMELLRLEFGKMAKELDGLNK